MPLSDDLAALRGAKRRRSWTKTCAIARLFDALPPDEVAALAALLDESDVYASEVSEVLSQHGHDISIGQIGHHRRRLNSGGCRCPLPKAKP
jgi:hypothetical protein